MREDLIARLQDECRRWPDRRVVQHFMRGLHGYASPKIWNVIRTEAFRRDLATEAVVRVLESRSYRGDLLDSACRITKGWGAAAWWLALAVFLLLLGTVVEWLSQ